MARHQGLWLVPHIDVPRLQLPLLGCRFSGLWAFHRCPWWFQIPAQLPVVPTKSLQTHIRMLGCTHYSISQGRQIRNRYRIIDMNTTVYALGHQMWTALVDSRPVTETNVQKLPTTLESWENDGWWHSQQCKSNVIHVLLHRVCWGSGQTPPSALHAHHVDATCDQSINQHEICRALLYDSSRSASNSQL